MLKLLRIFYILPLIVLMISAGCSKGPTKPPHFPKLYPCAITVTQEGQPVEDATVRFLPKSGTSEWLMTAKTNAMGVANMTTHVQFQGVPEGDFKVLITKIEATPSIFDGREPPQEGTPEHAIWLRGMEYEKRPNFALINTDYNNEKKTPFEITIQKGKNTSEFEVGPAIRKKISGG